MSTECEEMTMEWAARRIEELEAENALLRDENNDPVKQILLKRVEAAEAQLHCPSCASAGKPVSEKPCVCGGSGHITDAYANLLELYNEQSALYEEKEAQLAGMVEAAKKVVEMQPDRVWREGEKLTPRQLALDSLAAALSAAMNCSHCGGVVEPVPLSNVPGPPDPPLVQHLDDKTPATWTAQHVGPRCKRAEATLSAAPKPEQEAREGEKPLCEGTGWAVYDDGSHTAFCTVCSTNVPLWGYGWKKGEGKQGEGKLCDHFHGEEPTL